MAHLGRRQKLDLGLFSLTMDGTGRRGVVGEEIG